MDDDRFRKEVLSRLDEIVKLLSLLCGVSEASLEESEDAGRTAAASESGKLSMNDEMQESYDAAIRSWKSAKDS